MNQSKDIISHWPSHAAFARDIGAEYQLVQKWIWLNSIPGAWDCLIVEAANERGLDGVTHELLARSRDRRVERWSPAKDLAERKAKAAA